MKVFNALFSRKTPVLLKGSATLVIAFWMLALPQFVISVFAAVPVISNVTTTNVQSAGATVSWATDVASDTQIEYGLTTAYGSSTTLNGALTTSHTQTISGLQANQLYHYKVKSRDLSGDLATSGDRTFITALGTTTPGTGTDSGNSHTINTTRFTTVNGGKVGSLSVYVGAVDASAANRSFQLAIYAASGNVPGALIANTETGTLTGNAWNTLPITATLAPGTSYFIGYNTNGSSSTVNNMRYASGGTSGWSTNGQAFGTWPATFGSMSSQSVTFSLYASFVSDSVPPVVSITAPAGNTSVSGTTEITADATDDSSISSVQFFLNGNNLGTDTTAPYSTSWDTTKSLNGNQTLTAVATDVHGNSGTSPAVTVTTSNAPKAAITQPTTNQIIEATSITVTYTKAGDWLAGDGKHAHFRLDGGPTKMDFDADQNQSYTLTGVPAGNHTLEIIVAQGSHEEIAGTGMTVSFSSIAPDVTPPTVSVTSPNEGAIVQNTITLNADAVDETAVHGVQFLLDGNNLGAEDTTAPYSTTWNTTTVGNGTHTITARARDSLNQTISAPVTVNVQNTDPRAVVGEWGPLMNWPLVAVHSTLLHTGEILMWDAWDWAESTAKLWNPNTNTFTDVPAGAGLFCSGHATDADGNLIVMGGHTQQGGGIKDVYSFSPTTKSWTRKNDMQYPRWYPSVTQMPDNRMLTLSGQSVQGTFVNTPEIFNTKTNLNSIVPISTPQLREIQYPQTSVLPSGKILAISTEQGGVMTYDPSNNAWLNTGTTQVPYGVWTSFAPGKYLITGGGITFNDYHNMPNDPNPVASQKTSRILDMTSGAPVWSNAGTMHQGRSFHNVTMLPTGKALAIGGSTIISDFAKATESTVTAEQWDPATNNWTAMANPARPRMYHSTSMLLPDGRILSAGGGRLSPAPDELNAQFYSPSYLFQGPRPTITSNPSAISHNSTMDFVSPEAADIAKVSFVNLASVTHTADWNQRFLDLSFTRNGDTLTINTPANTNLAPDNYYMVFLVNSAGVPSQAKIVKLGTPDTAAPVISNVTSSNVASNTATVTWTTDESSDTQIEYGLTTAYGSSTTLNTTLVTAHSQTLNGLTPNTIYNYRVKSRDASGNLATSNNFTFTTGTIDTQPPSVIITAPTSNSSVSGVVNISADVSDNVGVSGVQFKVDGTNVGTELTTSPYTISWNSAVVGNGTHTITATARDATGNTTTSSPTTITVSNTTTSGLVAAYSFNEGAGTIVNDGSPYANHGSIFQATWFTAGKFGKALAFDGTNDYVAVNDSNSLDLTNRMTLEAWVRPTASSGWRTVMLKENGNELAYGMYARESSNRPSAWMRVNPTSGSSQSAGATPGLTLNTWTHMATTYDGAALKLYINGTLRATKNQTGNMYTSTSPLKFGGNAVWGEFFAGQLDEIRIYNRALTSTEIQTDMNLPL